MTICAMRGRYLSFKEILESACKPYRDLWDADGRLNLNAVARFTKKRGWYVSQPTLHRHYKGGKTQLHSPTVEALHKVLGVPRSILRGEPLSNDMEKLLTRFPLSTLLLAEKLDGLPTPVFANIARLIEEACEKEEQLRAALEQSGNVTHLDKHRR